MGRELADLRVFDGLEIDQYQLPVNRISNAVKDVVRCIARKATDEQLGRQQLPVSSFYLNVNVRARSAGIGNRLDGPESVLACRCCFEASKSLEILVPLGRLGSAVTRV